MESPDLISSPATEFAASDPSPSTLFQRRIDFQLARNPYNGFSNSAGFQLETLNPSSSTTVVSETHKASVRRAEGSELTENGLDPELSFRITFSRIGAGLQNLGNTCFLNSVLQCLTYTEPLAAYLQSGKHQNSCRTAGFCALCAIQKHVKIALKATGRILAPKDLVSNLRCISRNFRNSRQEDAHEYMVNLLESMHKCCIPSGVPSESPSAYEKSLVHKIFGGRLRSQVKCMQCSYCSNKFDPFLDLSLEIMKADSLYKALAHFTAKEQLDGGERQYHCQQCKQKVKALKQLTVYQAPHVLTIHLKRFGSHMSGQKIDKKIHFGPTLDLKPFVTGPYDGDLSYTLYGVLVHAGWSTHSGHYYCFVRTSSGMWYSLDDNQVIQVSERRVMEQKAYMLFYVRDRKNPTLKRPLDVVHKDALVNCSMGNKTKSNPNLQLKDTVQNGSIDRKLKNFLSAAADQASPVNTGALKEPAEREVTGQKVNVLKAASCSAMEKYHHSVPSSNLTSAIGSAKQAPIINVSREECLLRPVSSIKGSTATVNVNNITSLTMSTTFEGRSRSTIQKDLNMSGSNIVNTTQTEIDASPSLSPDSNGKRRSEIEKEHGDSMKRLSSPTEESSCQNLRNDRSLSVASPPQGPSDEKSSRKTMSSGEHDGMSQAPEARREISDNGVPLESTKEGGFPKKNISSSDTEKTHESCKLLDIQIGKVASHITKIKDPLQRRANNKHRLAARKKAFKCYAATMHLSYNIISGTPFMLRKKKKHKKSNCNDLKNKVLRPVHVVDGNIVPADLAPSTSEQSKSLTPDHSRRKRKNGGSDEEVCNQGKLDVKVNGGLSMRAINEESGERSGQRENMLASNVQPPKVSGLSSVQELSDASVPCSSTKDTRKSTKNDLMEMLTRGLDEKPVARWDDTEPSPMEFRDSRDAESVRIGHVGDEWDEEYDRGKRKKVRNSKFNFGGPNPFQVLANTKAEVKKSSMKRSSSANQPFRI